MADHLHTAMCLLQPLNTDICPSQINGLLCNEAAGFCLSASCIVEGVNAAEVYSSAKICLSSEPMKVCGDSEINFMASTCYGVNVGSTTGVCLLDKLQEQDSRTNESIGRCTFRLIVTSVINLASTSSKPPASATTGSGEPTPKASSSSQAHSLSLTFIIIAVIASAVTLLVIILTTTVCVIMIIKRSKSGAWLHDRKEGTILNYAHPHFIASLSLLSFKVKGILTSFCHFLLLHLPTSSSRKSRQLWTEQVSPCPLQDLYRI